MSVNKVEVINPPTTTVASGRWVSAPTPVDNSMGMRPRMATLAVIIAMPPISAHDPANNYLLTLFIQGNCSGAEIGHSRYNVYIAYTEASQWQP